MSSSLHTYRICREDDQGLKALKIMKKDIEKLIGCLLEETDLDQDEVFAVVSRYFDSLDKDYISQLIDKMTD